MIDREMLRGLRAQMQTALDGIAAKNGVVLTVGNCTYTDNTATFKLLVAADGFDGGKADFEKYAVWNGFDKADFGKDFVVNGVEYTICGWAHKSSKFPVLAKRNDGKVFKFSVESVLRIRNLLMHKDAP